jgi:branched-chain amino acid aminotransferase
MAIHRFVLHNGRIHQASEALLSPGQLGLLAGWGIFSTLRVADGVLFAWERHWARMSHDAQLLNVPIPADSEPVRRSLAELIEANQAFNATLRLVVVRNGGGMWEGPPTGRAGDVIALTADSNHWGDSVRLTYQPNARFAASDFVSAKMISWAANLRWYELAHERGFDECILLNEHGEVTECTSANIFAVFGKEVRTAPIAAGCLPGVTREVLLNEIHAPGIRIVESPLRPEDLEAADDVFITSTTRDLLPVAEIDGKKMNGRAEVRGALLTEFRRYLRAYVASNREIPRVPAGAANVN